VANYERYVKTVIAQHKEQAKVLTQSDLDHASETQSSQLVDMCGDLLSKAHRLEKEVNAIIAPHGIQKHRASFRDIISKQGNIENEVSAKHVGAGEEIINTNAACEVVHNKNCNACISEMVASFDQRIQVLEKHIHNCEVSVAAVGPQLAGVQHDIRLARQEIDNACAAAKADHV